MNMRRHRLAIEGGVPVLCPLHNHEPDTACADFFTDVPYSFSLGERCEGDWLAPRGDEELYDYNVDQWETVNRVANASYAAVLMELRAALRRQYTERPAGL